MLCLRYSLLDLGLVTLDLWGLVSSSINGDINTTCLLKLFWGLNVQVWSSVSSIIWSQLNLANFNSHCDCTKTVSDPRLFLLRPHVFPFSLLGSYSLVLHVFPGSYTRLVHEASLNSSSQVVVHEDLKKMNHVNQSCNPFGPSPFAFSPSPPLTSNNLFTDEFAFHIRKFSSQVAEENIRRGTLISKSFLELTGFISSVRYQH